MSTHEPRLIVPVSALDHSTGPADAPVTLVEYGDYECPYCGMAYPIVKQLQRQFGDRLQFVFRNFPITTSHPHAQHAAETAEAASAQERFWEMHDLLYENQRQLDDHHLRAYAERVGLDLDLFDGDFAGHKYADRVQEDFMGGVRSGVNGTPTFYINGVRHDASWDQESLAATIELATQ